MDIPITFSKDYLYLHFENNKESGIDLSKLPEDGYLKKNKNEYHHLLFGDIGKHIFLKNEKYLKPINTSLFNSFAKDNHFPIIMNFIEEECHLRFKKDLDKQFSLKNLNLFGDFISETNHLFWEQITQSNDEKELFDIIIEYVIKQQFFFLITMLAKRI